MSCPCPRCPHVKRKRGSQTMPVLDVPEDYEPPPSAAPANLFQTTIASESLRIKARQRAAAADKEAQDQAAVDRMFEALRTNLRRLGHAEETD